MGMDVLYKYTVIVYRDPEKSSAAFILDWRTATLRSDTEYNAPDSIITSTVNAYLPRTPPQILVTWTMRYTIRTEAKIVIPDDT